VGQVRATHRPLKNDLNHGMSQNCLILIKDMTQFSKVFLGRVGCLDPNPPRPAGTPP
jgi:hypothetical protein